jgi:hypothetical protein
VVVLKRLKTKNQISRNLSGKTQPDSAFRPSVTTIEEQGILESFARLPQAEREIVRQLLDEFGSQRAAVIRSPVPFGPKSISERARFLSPIYRLIRYHRLIFDSVADGVFRSTYIPWIEAITHVRAGEKEEIALRLNSNYENVWRMLKERLDEPTVRLKSQYSTRLYLKQRALDPALKEINQQSDIQLKIEFVGRGTFRKILSWVFE